MLAASGPAVSKGFGWFGLAGLGNREGRIEPRGDGTDGRHPHDWASFHMEIPDHPMPHLFRESTNVQLRTEGNAPAVSELRRVLSLRQAELRGRQAGPPPSLSESVVPLESLASRVTRFREQLRQRMQETAMAGTSAESVGLRYLDRYRDQLFGHPVAHDEIGHPLAIVERTNDPAEHTCATDKRCLRRRLGHADLGWAMQDQPAQATLTANLLDPQ